ncbi:MAG: SDR family NAD(P)-dependent oxidoreductase [Anaerobiospirillum succiniciproducens]|uniref:SDR family NAD(P)-dependent oxidoreductase n=1 Tax=Anaerobiospirillum succiniciproducens TaxID=13335 RepID=UPI0026DCE829|nr:SDR family NAD(P)-dependent oxidoreductase [Anaerobiospirillum succiniciproducens]MDO4676781.1 SDR family NAD(P)-dependent oxidoreductase [Anaerobiospirillum succiniciproducens]
MRRMLVLGATSEIAIATLHEFAKEEPWHMILCGRNLSELEKLKTKLESHKCTCEVKHYDTSMSAAEQMQLFNECLGQGTNTQQTKAQNNALATTQTTKVNPLATASTTAFDASATASTDAYNAAVKDIAKQYMQVSERQTSQFIGLDALFCSVGYLGDQKKAEQDIRECDLIMQANFNGLLPMLTATAKFFKQQRSGSIMVVSSVAGERGRCSNYCYGSSKAAMTAFLSGMRCSLLPYNVHVMTIKPGYVATRMVAHKKLPPYITASTQRVAKDIVKGFKRRSSVVYTMWLWRYIMAVVRLIPEFIFKRLNMF